MSVLTTRRRELLNSTTRNARPLILYDGATYDSLWSATKGTIDGSLQVNTNQNHFFTYVGGEFELFETDTVRVTFGEQTGSDALCLIIGTNTSSAYAPNSAFGNITDPDNLNEHSSFADKPSTCTLNSTSGNTYGLAIDVPGIYGSETAPFAIWTYGAKPNITKIEII